MSSEWRSGRLGEFIELKRGYDLPQAKREKGSIPLISSSGHSDYHSEAKVSGPGVVTGRYGTIGQVFYVQQDFWPLNTTLYVKDFKGNDPKFIHYFLKTLDFLAYSDKAAVPGVNRNHLHEALVNVPRVNLQLEIAGFLGALDDRIALLRETNTTLEAIAQALFKSWFVDFDPVHANAGTQAPSLPAEIQALFPSRLVESRQGLIPEGWEFKKFLDVIDKYIDNRGKTPPTVDEGIPLLEIKHLPENEISPSVNIDKKVSQETYDTWFRAHPMKNDILMSTVGTIGRLSIMGNQRVAIAQNILGLRVGGVVAPEYMYYLMKDNKFKSDVNARLVITVQASIKRKDLNTIDVLVPSKAAQSLFIDTVSQLIEKQRLNDEQAQNLANLRDTLLPRLISGQLRLTEAEAALADVV